MNNSQRLEISTSYNQIQEKINCFVGVDYCDSITMYFKDKRVAQLNLHQESFLSNCAVISGDKGNIEVCLYVFPCNNSDK